MKKVEPYNIGAVFYKDNRTIRMLDISLYRSYKILSYVPDFILEKETEDNLKLYALGVLNDTDILFKLHGLNIDVEFNRVIDTILLYIEYVTLLSKQCNQYDNISLIFNLLNNDNGIHINLSRLLDLSNIMVKVLSSDKINVIVLPKSI